MLNFKKTNIVFIILALLLGALATRYHIAWYLYVLMLWLYSLVLFYGSYYVGSNFL